MIEFDIRRTVDGVLVVHHDSHIGAREIETAEYKAIASLGAFTLPLFADVLALAADKIGMDVEIKEPGFEETVLRELRDRRVDRSQLLITSFHTGTVTAIGHGVAAGLLVENMQWAAALDLFHRIQPDFLAPDYKMIEPGSRIPLLPWTVDTPGDIQRILAEPEVFGLITDQPGKALKIRT